MVIRPYFHGSRLLFVQLRQFAKNILAMGNAQTDGANQIRSGLADVEFSLPLDDERKSD
jgi:hypothetical protein